MQNERGYEPRNEWQIKWIWIIGRNVYWIFSALYRLLYCRKISAFMTRNFYSRHRKKGVSQITQFSFDVRRKKEGKLQCKRLFTVAKEGGNLFHDDNRKIAFEQRMREISNASTLSMKHIKSLMENKFGFTS